MSEERTGQWTSPERQEDEKYRETMDSFFAPDRGKGAKNGAVFPRLRGPLKDDDTAVMPQAGSADAPPAGGDGARDVGQGTAGPGTGTSVRKALMVAGLAALAILVVALPVWLIFGRDGGEDAGGPDRAPAGVGALPVEETGLVFELEDGEGDAYAVRLGEYEWEGTEAMNGDVEEVVLEGRTAAHFTTAVRLADGEIQTGVFGRAEPGKPLWHATYQRTTTGEQQTTTGTYTVVEDERVVLEGAYTDRVVEDNPGEEPDLIERTYVEGDPTKPEQDATRFRVSFRAGEDVEIPWLPGNPVAEETGEGSAG